MPVWQAGVYVGKRQHGRTLPSNHWCGTWSNVCFLMLFQGFWSPKTSYSIIKTYIKRISPANALHLIATYWLLPATREKGQQQWPEITMKSIHQEDLRGISLPPLQGVSNHHWVCPLHILCMFFGWSFTLQPEGDSTNQFDASSDVFYVFCCCVFKPLLVLRHPSSPPATYPCHQWTEVAPGCGEAAASGTTPNNNARGSRDL